MSELEFLFHHGFIDVASLIQRYYLRLGLNETQAMVLQLLYQQEIKGQPTLEISVLANKTSLEAEKLSSTINQLIEQEYLALSTIDEEGQLQEVYSVFPVVTHILKMTHDVSDAQKQDTMRLIEAELKRPLSSKEIQIIDGWTYDFLTIKSAVLASIKQQKIGVEYINKILENQAQAPKDMSYFEQFLKD